MISARMSKVERLGWATGTVLRTVRLAGVTLTEVLMAILIAGIGLVAVVTLFPIAILRSVHATQLTNATILRYNAEAMIDVLPRIIHDPDGDTLLSKTTAPDPLDPRTDRSQPEPLLGHRPYVEHFSERFIVDPIGWWIIGKDYLQTRPRLRLWFGNDGDTTGTPPVPNPVPVLRRYNAGLNPGRRATGAPADWNTLERDRTEEAFRLASLPDSWILQWEGVPDAVTRRSVTLPPTFDVSNFPANQSRVVLFDTSDGRSGQVRQPVVVSSGAPPVLSWSVPLPGDLNNVGRVRIETREYRYTWLLTVRKNGFGDAQIDVVILFRRPFALKDEYVYDATFAAGKKRVGIMFTHTHPDGRKNALPEPFVKRGGFVFDVTNGRWYRVIEYEQNVNGYDLVLTLERRASESAGEDTVLLNNAPDTEDSNGNGQLDQGEDLNDNGRLDPPEDRNRNGRIDYGGAIFMRGVVEVFPISPRMLPRELLEQIMGP